MRYFWPHLLFVSKAGIRRRVLANFKQSQVFQRAMMILSAVIAGQVPQPAFGEPKMIELDPVSKWHVDWTPTSCTLARAFDDAKKPTILLFEQFAPGDAFQLLVTSKYLKNLRQLDRPTIIYGSPADGIGEATQKLSHPLLGDSSLGAPTLVVPQSSLTGPIESMAMHWIDREIYTRTNRISLEWRGRAVVIKTGPLDKAFAALRECTFDLVRTWGLDSEQQKHLSRHAWPKADPRSWLETEDYPPSALQEYKQAVVNFRLLVDAAGTPTKCDIPKSYSDAQFDKTTCELLMRRAQFEPALDSEGKPVPSYFFNTATWIIR